MRLDFPKVTISWGLGRAFSADPSPKTFPAGYTGSFQGRVRLFRQAAKFETLEYLIDDLGTEDRKGVTASVTEEAGKRGLGAGC